MILKNVRRLSALSTTTLLWIGWPLHVLAQTLIPANNVIETTSCPICSFRTGDLHLCCVVNYLKYIIALVYTLLGAFFLIAIIIAGYRIALGPATGDTEGGKKMLKTAIIGFIIASLSFFIIQFIISALAGP
ncbi:MAG: hypothetical protein V1926_04290 [Candidatus Peregrinibacteria bacterium]